MAHDQLLYTRPDTDFQYAQCFRLQDFLKALFHPEALDGTYLIIYRKNRR